MHRIAPKVHEAYLKNVSLQGLEKFEDLCTRLSQCTDGGDFCKDAIFDALKLSKDTETATATETETDTDTNTGAAFGRQRHNHHHRHHHRQRRPKRRSKRIQGLKSRPNYCV